MLFENILWGSLFINLWLRLEAFSHGVHLRSRVVVIYHDSSSDIENSDVTFYLLQGREQSDPEQNGGENLRLGMVTFDY